MSAVDKLPVDFRGAVTEVIDRGGIRGDDQFSRAVVTAAVRRILTAWVDAVTAQPNDLASMANPDVVEHLLTPRTGLGQQCRLVAHNPRVSQVEVAGIDTSAASPTLAIEIRLIARWWVENLDRGTISSGYADADTEVWVSWTLARDKSGPVSWRLIDGSASTVEQIFAYRYVTRQETPDEYRDRTRDADIDASPAPGGKRQYLISASWVEHDERIADTACFVVDLDGVPTRDEAAELANPVIKEAFRRRRPGLEYFNVELTRLEAVELLDVAPPTRNPGLSV